MDILLTAALSSLLTLAGAYFAGRHVLLERIRPEVDAMIDSRFAQAAEIIEERVRSGVVSAVEEVTSPENLQKQMSRGQDSLMNALFGNLDERR